MAGLTSQGAEAVAVGDIAGQYNQGASATALGIAAGETSQGVRGVAVGQQAGRYNQGTDSTALGREAGRSSQGTRSVAIGLQAGLVSQNPDAVAIGCDAGCNAQKQYGVAIGRNAGCSSQNLNSVAIGVDAGRYGQGSLNVAIGSAAGSSNQGIRSIAIGDTAGRSNQSNYCTAIGYVTGNTGQGQFATTVGSFCAQTNQGDFAIALGHASGRYNQGTRCIAIGQYAGMNSQRSQSIVIDATSETVNPGSVNALYIHPMRNVNSPSGLTMFRHSSKEITYGTPTSDDRLKFNESVINNATSTLMKLRPEKYDKLVELDGNLSNSHPEFGFIAQEVWYKTPELRNIVQPGVGAVPDETIDIPDDPEQDPDYSSWGTLPCGLLPEQLIPWLVKGVQEINNELPRHRIKVPSALYSNISQYTGMIVSKSPTISLSNISNDKSYFGIITDKPLDTNDSEILVQSSGEAHVWITDVNGPLEAGDFVVTSNIAGYGLKQDDDIVHSYTVAKTTIPCDFNPQQVPVKRIIQQSGNVSYWTYNYLEATVKSEYDLMREHEREFKIIKQYSHPDGLITEDEFNNLSEDDKLSYEEITTDMYYFKKTKEFTKNPNDDKFTHEVRQELVNVLDENGQVTWEDTGETEPEYIVIDHGTYKSALVPCKLV
jgi:hypothetical protein